MVFLRRDAYDGNNFFLEVKGQNEQYYIWVILFVDAIADLIDHETKEMALKIPKGERQQISLSIKFK